MYEAAHANGGALVQVRLDVRRMAAEAPQPRHPATLLQVMHSPVDDRKAVTGHDS